MRTKENHKEYTYVSSIEFMMKYSDAKMCSHIGRCDDDCEIACDMPYIRKQLDQLSDKQMELAIREYGIEFEEYKGKEIPRNVLELYIVWLAAGNITDDVYERDNAA